MRGGLRRFGLLLALAVLAACTRAGGAAGAAPNDGVLRIGDNQDITSLNPHLATATSLSNIADMTMAFLVRADERNRPVPELATEVPSQANGGISRDGKTITWHLRRNVKWSDGVPFDGDDLVFSTRVVLNPANNETSRSGFDLITKIDEPDKFTVVYHLKRPFSSFLPTFFGTAGANPCLLPKHLLAKLRDINNADYNAKPVGIGPFRVVEWVRGDHVEMEANPYYWRGTPKLRRVVYRFIPDRNTLLTQLQTGEIDLWPYLGEAYYARAAALPGVTVFKKPDYYFAHLDFNLTRPVFADVAVRRALRLAIDRRTIVEKVNHGLGIVQEGIETPVSPMYASVPFIAYDPVQANAMLDAAGWRRGADGVRAKNGLRLNLTFALRAGNPDDDQMVELLRTNWQQIGVRLDVRRYQPALFFGPFQQHGIIYAGTFDVVFFNWGLDPTGDLSNLYECNQIPPAGQNDVRYCNPSTDRLLEAVKATYDDAQRRALVAQIVAAIDRDVPTIVLYIRDGIHAYRTTLRNWHPNQVSPFDDMMNVESGASGT